MNKFIVLYGPTGVGKTDIGLKIAEEINAEIINMDVGQFYTPLSVGTAKPDWKNSITQHHLFDCIDNPVNLSVVEYKKRVISIMNSLWKRGKTPLLIGGSGFYLYSLLFDISNEEASHGQPTQDDSRWEELHSLDLRRAKQIHPNDHYRIARAVQICKQTNSLSSDYLPQFRPVAPCDIIFLSRDREDLYKRINQRTSDMFSSGFIEEVQTLLDTPWEEFMLEKKLIGYNELVSYLKYSKGIHVTTFKSIDDVKQAMAQRTRHYAKRQFTFWRYLEKKLTMVKENKETECRRYIVDLTANQDNDSMQKILNYVKN